MVAENNGCDASGSWSRALLLPEKSWVALLAEYVVTLDALVALVAFLTSAFVPLWSRRRPPAAKGLLAAAVKTFAVLIGLENPI